MRILIVEDEEKLAKVLSHGLAAKGYAVDIISDGKKALSRLSLHRSDYDLVIMDLGLPSMGGLEILKTAREWQVTTPILILSAEKETGKKVELLMAGADDYLIKPFSFAELSARMHALLRRPKEMTPGILEAGNIRLHPAERKVFRDDVEIMLTLKEYALLEYFMRNPNRVINREDLLTHLWDFNYASFSNVVDVHVKNLRHKLDGGTTVNMLETVRGVGYRLRT